jgi:hypothetical protein
MIAALVVFMYLALWWVAVYVGVQSEDPHLQIGSRLTGEEIVWMIGEGEPITWDAYCKRMYGPEGE